MRLPLKRKRKLSFSLLITQRFYAYTTYGIYSDFNIQIQIKNTYVHCKINQKRGHLVANVKRRKKFKKNGRSRSCFYFLLGKNEKIIENLLDNKFNIISLNSK